MSRTGRPFLPVQDRFEKRINITDECWNWTGALSDKGYGQLRFRGRVWFAHRLSYWFFNGSLGDGMEVCHSCDNPQCVNPDHLWLGTHKQNINDAARKGKMSTTKKREKKDLMSMAQFKKIREHLYRIGEKNHDKYLFG